MVIIQIYKDNAEQFANVASAVSFDFVKKRLKLYFSDLKKVEKKIIDGEIINIPYVTFQRDRRIKKTKVKNERRTYQKNLILE